MNQGKDQKDMMITCPDCGHHVPDGKGVCIYCGAALDEEAANTDCKMNMIDEDIRWSFSLPKSRRPIQLSPMIQALIFLVSAAIGGFLVLLMG